MTRIAIVASSATTSDDARAQHARRLSLGLAEAGLDVDHVAADHTVAPWLWDGLRQRARSYDLVHLLGVRALPAALAAHGRSRAVVVSPQLGAGSVPKLRGLLHMPSGHASRMLLEMANRIVCATEAEAERVTAILPGVHGRLRVVPLGVDTALVRQAEPLPSGAKVVVALSSPGRGHRIARVIAALADLGPGFEVVVVGRCTQERQLSAEAAELGLLDRVHFLGPVEDPALHRWLRTACAVVSLSERWTSPHVLLTALAAGTPIVVSDVALHVDALRDRHGIGVTLVPNDVSPLALADSLAEAARLRLSPTASPGLPTVEDEIAGLVDVYGELVELRGDAKALRSGQGARQAS